MPITITTKGWITLHRDGALISQHAVESKAIEAALEHAEANGNGDYELRFPNKVLRVLLTKTVLPFRWSAITVSLTAGTATSVNVAQYLNNPDGRPVTFTVSGTLPTGATLSSAGLLTFNGATNAVSASVQFVATSGDLVAQSSATTVSVAPPPLQNTAPVFSVAPATVELGSNGGTIQFTAVDPQGDAVSYSLPTTRTGITINASTGLVTVTSSAAGTAGSIVVRASDGVLTATATCAVTVAADDTIKWRPGHYVKTQGDHSATDQAAYLAGVQTTFQRSLDMALLRGNEAALAWGAINPTGSTFNGSAIDSWLAWHEANDRRLILEVSYKNFRPAVGVLAPADLIASGNVVQTLTGWIAAVWRPAVMDRFIAAMQWVASRYDSHPRLELVLTSESAPSVVSSQVPDYSQAALHTQLQRLISACATAFNRTTTIVPQINNLGTYPPQLIEGAYQAGGGFGSPDCRPTSESILLFAGETVDGIGTGLRDYRGQMAHFDIGSISALEEFNGNMPGLINFAQQYAVTHLSWVTSSAVAGQTWAEIKAAITNDPGLTTSCPTIYGGRCEAA